jgi:hypothetical protein
MRGSFFAMECLTDDDVSIAWPSAAQISASRGHAGVAGETASVLFEMVANQLPPYNTLGAGIEERS